MLASVYSTQGDYVAASLHLRSALHISVFSEAVLSLKLIRCSLKFKEEQLFLRNKMRVKERQVLQEEQDKLVREMADAVLHGKPLEPRNEPPLILEDIEPPEIPEMRVQEMKPAEFTGEDAIRYLTSLSLLRRARLHRLSAKERQSLEELSKQPQEGAKVNKEHKSAKETIVINNSPQQEMPAIVTKHTSKEIQQKPIVGTKEDPPPVLSDTIAQLNTTNQTTAKQPSYAESELAPKERDLLEKSAADKVTDKDADNARKNEATQTSPPPPKRKGKTHEEIREEEIKKRFPGTRPWPTVDECLEQPPPRKLVFTSTWLSVTAKGAK